MSTVLFEIKQGVAFLMLNRPEKLNAFNRDMALLLQAKLDECASRPEVRSIYITGSGRGFSAGQDLSEVMYGEEADLKSTNRVAEYYNPIASKIRQLSKPVLAAVNGIAAGAGANIALCCDVVVAAQSANFVQAFSKIGLVPDSGGTFMLPRLVGWQTASALMMLSEKITAEEAFRLGMVYKVFSDSEFSSRSTDLALALARMPAQGLALTKYALNASQTNSLDEQLLLEDRLQEKAVKTRDHREAINAFLEKRNPKFTAE
jgi:2-(1,2-epoxy-1,2-dihydrophenyl)acetyl-CoA isomerase